MALKTVYLGLGSNLGDRRSMLQAALDALESAAVHIRRISPVYESEPQDLRDQGWFLNLVAEAETTLFPMQLLRRIGRIEHRLGRRRTIAKGPRTIDIDILFIGAAVIETAALTVPHPRAAQRRFVLLPMADLAPDFRHPMLRKTIRELLPSTAGQEIRPADCPLRLPQR